ncbi:MAG: 3-deoxy-D-manno-octulosonic acid transferase [Alphaproteobacteria bacterium]|nr:3-deoxy-D-manno-octulosonic acid transferase [Alphaproteobacteria bacterium]
MGSLYKILSYLLSPFLQIYFYSRCLYGKDNWKDVQNHFGRPNKARPSGELIWIHAVSIGESTAALTYIKHLKKQNPRINILLTTTTVTSAKILESKLKDINGCIHQFSVADNPRWIRKFLDYWNPEKAFFLESEIWPNTVDQLYKRNIPLFLLNARLSPRSFKRWTYLKKFFSSVLEKFTRILAQSELDEKRFKFFSDQNVFKADNLKYANSALPCNDELLSKLKEICKNKKILAAASTHGGEEAEILKAHRELKKEFDLVTVIIPRHLNRIAEIKKLFDKYHLTYQLRSQLSSVAADIILIDTFGEVGTCFRLTDVAFVGGSLVPIGGHNIYEPVALGKPVLFGPHMENALEVRNLVLENKVGFEVKSHKDIVVYCRQFFSAPDLLENIKEKTAKLTRNEALQQIDEIVNFSLQKFCNRDKR